MANQIILSEVGCPSFELKKTSKGYSWNIKIYNANIEQAYGKAKEINTLAVEEYGQFTKEEGE